LFFNHKLTGADFRARKAWFENKQPAKESKKQRSKSSNAAESVNSGRAPEIEVEFDYLIGADGAHSASRFHMMKYARVDYQQEYIDTLWCEFRIAPSESGDFRISPSHLHIWPGQKFMFIALPSPDKSFTCTLFAPASDYETLNQSPEKLLQFFQDHLPGVSPELIPPEELHQQFSQNPHLPLIGIKCNPHHYGSSVVIVGDAAHAVLPFYGQGLNAGLEDVRVLFEVLDRHNVFDASADVAVRESAREAAFKAYTNQRVSDAHAINDLSKTNYAEMRSGVTSRLYKLRKFIEETLDRYVPRLGWQTQYTRVSFSNMRYSEVMNAAERQRRILSIGLSTILFSSMITAFTLGGLMVWKFPRQFTPHRILGSWSLKQFYRSAYAS
jgi:kynurenine 3-monooxygenase